ncbi:MAG: undecaprenyl-diphosphate phosphatase [bacterium]
MSIVQALILGLLQGVTEFLPVSSSGHLVIMQHYLGLRRPLVSFDVALHTATLVVVLIYFRHDLGSIIGSLIRLKSPHSQALLERKIFYLIIVGTIPTAILGLILRIWANLLFTRVVITSATLIITGIILRVGGKTKKTGKGIKEMGIMDALLIGVMQGIAIVPGISRSGATISTGLLRGINRESSFRYSFLLSIPAILGALSLSLKDVLIEKIFPPHPLPWIAGASSAFVAGYLSLIILRKSVLKGKLSLFSYYCWVLGIGSLILWIWRYLTFKVVLLP